MAYLIEPFNIIISKDRLAFYIEEELFKVLNVVSEVCWVSGKRLQETHNLSINFILHFQADIRAAFA